MSKIFTVCLLLLKLLFLKTLFKGWIVANLIGLVCSEFFGWSFIISNYFYLLSLIFLVTSLTLESYKKRIVFYNVFQIDKYVFRTAMFVLVVLFMTIQILLF